MIQYEQVVYKLNTLISHDSYDHDRKFWQIELSKHYIDDETIILIHLLDTGCGNKYRLYHSELNDWVTNDSQLWECCICELREIYHNIKNVMGCLLESCSVVRVMEE